MENINKTWYSLIFQQKNVFIEFFAVIFSVVVLGILANITVPLWPVPVTMQTFGVFLIAFFFGSKRGVVAILSYLVAGLIGFGVFAGHKSGYAALIGPTAGYIIGFVFMAIIVGLLIEKGFGRDFKSVMYCMLVGQVVLYVCGLIGLSFFLGHPGIMTVLQLGFFPFVVGDIIKALAAGALFPKVWKGLSRISAN